MRIKTIMNSNNRKLGNQCLVFILCVFLLILGSAICYSEQHNTYAYVSFSDGTIGQYRLTPGGTFVTTTTDLVKVGPWPSRIAVTPPGSFAYVVDTGKTITSFRVNDNGSLASNWRVSSVFTISSTACLIEKRYFGL